MRPGWVLAHSSMCQSFVGPHHRGRLVAIGGVHEQLAAEPREGREAQRTQHTVGIHIAYPVADVVAAGADLLDAGGFTAELLTRPSGDRVQRGVEDLPAVVAPGHGAVVATDEPGALSRTSWAPDPSNRCAGSMTWSSTLTRIMSSMFAGPPLFMTSRIRRWPISNRSSHGAVAVKVLYPA